MDPDSFTSLDILLASSPSANLFLEGTLLTVSGSEPSVSELPVDAEAPSSGDAIAFCVIA
ncbi:pheromone-like protein [Rhodocollybia butyracea]|uniref:Pheromone-like protein n=1 Tax=Rhodocollybia butyracea TaxID=206335 RepID=A0A9P5P6U7_9AGAR|nr:pheromone-like protein [Rhodocollybia butyracea]